MKRPTRLIPGAALGLVVLLCCACCHKPPPWDPLQNGYRYPFEDADISYQELATRYNQTVEPFDTLWTRNDVLLEWTDEDGDYQFHTGDGKFYLRRPGETALQVEKLGRTVLWAGCNNAQYWLFEQIDSDNKTAYVGSFSRLGELGTRRYPLPVRPDLTPYLIGLMPLPTTLADPPKVQRYDGRYVVELEGMRMLIDPITFRPVRVDMTDEQGFSVLICKMTGSFPVSVVGRAVAAPPTICKNAEIFVAGIQSRFTLETVNAEVNPGKIKDAMFDLDALMNTKLLKPHKVESLDGP